MEEKEGERKRGNVERRRKGEREPGGPMMDLESSQ